MLATLLAQADSTSPPDYTAPLKHEVALRAAYLLVKILIFGGGIAATVITGMMLLRAARSARERQGFGSLSASVNRQRVAEITAQAVASLPGLGSMARSKRLRVINGGGAGATTERLAADLARRHGWQLVPHTDSELVARDRPAAVVPVLGESLDLERLQERGDLLRRELERAFRTGAPVVPVQVNDRPMPDASALPESLKPLSRLNGVPVWTDGNWDQHVDVLARHLRERIRDR